MNMKIEEEAEEEKRNKTLLTFHLHFYIIYPLHSLFLSFFFLLFLAIRNKAYFC